MKQSLIDILETYLSNHPEWVASGFLTDDHKWYKRNGTKYTSQSVGRKLRLGEEQKRWAVKQNPSGMGHVYKYLPKERRASYIPFSLRLKDQEHILFYSTEVYNRLGSILDKTL